MKRLLLVTGNDELAVRRKTTQLVDALKAEIPDELAFETIKGDREGLSPHDVVGELIMALRTPSFFGTERVLWLRNLVGATPAKSDADDDAKSSKKAADPLEPLRELLDAKGLDDVTLVMDIPHLDQRKAFYKTCEKLGETFVFKKISLDDKNYQQSLRERIAELCAKAQVRVSRDAMEFLAETVGGDSGRLDNEIEKLLLYSDPAQGITLKDCREICARSPEASTWVFADALAAKDLRQAFSALDTIIEQMRGEKGGSSSPEMALLYGAIRKFQDLAQIKAGAAAAGVRGGSNPNSFQAAIQSVSEDVKAELPGNITFSYHPYRAFMLHKLAASWSDRELADALELTLETNIQLVSGVTSTRIALENLITGVCAKN